MSDKPTEIIETLESIREDEYPEIPPEVVEEIAQVEYESLENRDQVQRKISELIEKYLEE